MSAGKDRSDNGGQAKCRQSGAFPGSKTKEQQANQNVHILCSINLLYMYRNDNNSTIGAFKMKTKIFLILGL